MPIIIVVVIVSVIIILMSFDTLEYQEMGLNYSWISETVQRETYSSGRYYLGLGNHFIKFPSMVKSVFFLDDMSPSTQGPALQSRTRDGLNVRLEVSFQYRLMFQDLYKLYTSLGVHYEKTLVRMAIEQLTTAATMHNAHNFFNNRSTIGAEMHDLLESHFKIHAYAEVPFFQLRTVHLPDDFEAAIQDTQVKQQEIQIASAEQSQNKVSYETKVLQAKQAVRVMQNQGEAEASAIMAANDAYCRQYNVTQSLQSEALSLLMDSARWKPKQLLEYLRIRAVREHPPEHTTIKI
jgi:regulator of protease activity HflC (stomatin/prohibitin superfamily)